jgi:hypothetical protein
MQFLDVTQLPSYIIAVIALNLLRDKEQFRENGSTFSWIDALEEEMKAPGEAALCILYV